MTDTIMCIVLFWNEKSYLANSESYFKNVVG